MAITFWARIFLDYFEFKPNSFTLFRKHWEFLENLERFAYFLIELKKVIDDTYCWKIYLHFAVETVLLTQNRKPKCFAGRKYENR